MLVIMESWLQSLVVESGVNSEYTLGSKKEKEPRKAGNQANEKHISVQDNKYIFTLVLIEMLVLS